MKRSLVTGAALGLFLCFTALGQPATQPTTQPMAGTFEAYQSEGTALEKQFKLLVPDNDLMADSNTDRSAVAAKGIPILKNVLVDLDGMVRTKPAYKWPVYPVHNLTMAQLYALGDADTISAMDHQAKQPGRDGLCAKRIVLQAHWFMAGQDPDKLDKAMADLDQLAQMEPTDSSLTILISEMGSSAKDPDVKQHMVDLLRTTMDGPTADAALRKISNQDKTNSFQGKPMVLSGKLPNGQDFTTADWKGKVVLVDFWAVWCSPCRAELPRVQKVYNQYHDKGFEVLGVDNDYDPRAVTNYAAKSNLPWPQLYDAAAGEKKAWNPLTAHFGIEGIPVMFLIDKKGICRTVTARDDFEKLIPQLLAD